MKRLTLITMLLCCWAMASAQNRTTLSRDEMATYEAEVQHMVNYLQETLNFIGDPESTAQEKEIVFSESYTKIFQDDQVQIEDDLDANRTTSLNKDVQAYLKDVDFFFQQVTFTFDIQNIACLYKDNGSPYFKVTLNRRMAGRYVTNDTVNDVKTRYIEINLDQTRNDLKIASIYTTRINERESLRYWWNSMPSTWKNYFGGELRINQTIPLKNVMQLNETDFIYSYPVLSVADGDTVASEWREVVVREGVDEVYAKLKGLAMMQTIDVSNFRTITTLDPLTELSDLTSLNISGTNVSDLTPLRNANKLRVLNASNTRIDDLSALRYDIMLEDLNVAGTSVSDLSVFEMLHNLEKLNLSNTMVTTLEPVVNCPNLTDLVAEGSRIDDITPWSGLSNIVSVDVSRTNVRDLTPLSQLATLQSLKISNTRVSNLTALQEMASLRDLYCSNTSINDLTPLRNHRQLRKIYCDNTRIDVRQASEFTQANPFTLVIYDTNALQQWWDELPIYWKAVFSRQIAIEDHPTTEQLHEVINMTELDLSDNTFIQNLLPVSRLTNLVTLNIANTEITSLMPLSGMTYLEYINLENTYVEDLGPVGGMNRLKEIVLNNTPVRRLEPLVDNSHLEMVWADNSGVDRQQAELLKSAVPGVTVVYQTDALRTWWHQLDGVWQTLLLNHLHSDSYEPTPKELQQIVNLSTIQIEQENIIQTLEPLTQFTWLEKVIVTNQGIHDILPLANKIHLVEVQLQNNPIVDLTPLENDTLISILNIENTQVRDLSKISGLIHLHILNAGGTSVRSLKPLSRLTELEELSVNNTSVRSISPIEDIASLRLLKIYNTRVRRRTVNSLQQRRYDLNIIYY